MSSDPWAEHGSVAATDVVPTRPPESTNNTHGAPPPADWQRRLWSALTDSPRLAMVFGLELAILLAAVGVFIGLRGAPVYSSKAVMLIDDPYRLATAGDDGQLVKLSALRVKYSALAGTSAMAQPVAAELHLPMSTVLDEVTVQVPLESLLMDVVSSAPTARRARELTAAMSSEITTYVQHEDATYAIPASDRFTITSIGPPSAATSSGPSRSHAVTLGAGLGAIGFLVGFCATQLLRRRKSVR